MNKLTSLAIAIVALVSCSTSDNEGEDVLEGNGIVQQLADNNNSTNTKTQPNSSSSTTTVNAFDENIESKNEDVTQGVIVINCNGFVATSDSFSDLQKQELLDMDLKEFSDEILRLVNEHRVDLGLNILKSNVTAKWLAMEHNLNQIAIEDIGHTNFDNRFCPLVRIESVKRVAENVGRRQLSAAQVVNEWLASSGHRANIEGVFDQIGITSIKASNGDLYFTQLFLKL